MGHRRNGSKRGGLTASVAAAALVLAGVPTAGLAIEALGSAAAAPHFDSGAFPFTPASVDPKLAKFMAESATGSARLMRFTPAGAAEHGERAVTVAVRVDEESAHAIAVRSAIAAAQDQMSATSAVRITPMRYNLGLARGYQGFAQASVLSKKLSDAQMPDLSSYRPAPVAQDEPSRFASRIALEHEEKLGSAPRTRDAIGEQSLDVGGSYRLTRNLDVTAGVRYSQERDRLTSLTERTQQDSQAVYIGTQFRF
jgi:hypothetical protein